MQLLPDAELSKSCYPLANALLKVPFLKKKLKKKSYRSPVIPPPMRSSRYHFSREKLQKN